LCKSKGTKEEEVEEEKDKSATPEEEERETVNRDRGAGERERERERAAGNGRAARGRRRRKLHERGIERGKRGAPHAVATNAIAVSVNKKNKGKVRRRQETRKEAAVVCSFWNEHHSAPHLPSPHGR
jgi:hypothetical protein